MYIIYWQILNSKEGKTVYVARKFRAYFLYVSDKSIILTLCLPVSSADNLGKQFGPRSGPTNRRA